MSKAYSKEVISEILRGLGERDIAQCAGCEGWCLSEHMADRVGSMRNELAFCPECDLEPMWSSYWSERRQRRYYVFFDPAQPKVQAVRWSHPTVGNPLHLRGEMARKVPRGSGDKHRSKGVYKK